MDNDREYTGQSTMSKENIINLISFNIVKPRLSLAPVLLHSLTPNLNLTQPKRVHFSSLELDTIVIRLVSPLSSPENELNAPI